MSLAPKSADHLLRDSRRNVEINVGKACNNRCTFCIDGLPKAEDRSYISRDHAFSEIERWAASGHQSLGFLGGEPTTWRWLPDAVAHARSQGFTRVAIATNATKLRLPHYTDRLVEAGLTRVTVSMHGHTADLEDRLTRVPGNFKKKVVALRYLLKKKAEGHLVDNVSVNVVVNGWNAPHLVQIMKFFWRLGLDDLRFNFIRTEGYALEDDSLTPRFTAVVPHMMKCLLLNELRYKRSLTFSGVPLCQYPASFLGNQALVQRYLGEFRDLDTDCSVRSESLTPWGIEEIDAGRARFNWQERKRNDLKTKPAACEGCAYDAPCEGVWKEWLTRYGPHDLRPL